mmetsp:Transcript_19400/g.57678  ORF Transcript_19400/g.57678 Transcript_19400/m.57678 type:complete len:374 (-) Transcript_19400:9-1130(-)
MRMLDSATRADDEPQASSRVAQRHAPRRGEAPEHRRRRPALGLRRARRGRGREALRRGGDEKSAHVLAPHRPGLRAPRAVEGGLRVQPAGGAQLPAGPTGGAVLGHGGHGVGEEAGGQLGGRPGRVQGRGPARGDEAEGQQRLGRRRGLGLGAKVRRGLEDAGAHGPHDVGPDELLVVPEDRQAPDRRRRALRRGLLREHEAAVQNQPAHGLVQLHSHVPPRSRDPAGLPPAGGRRDAGVGAGQGVHVRHVHLPRRGERLGREPLHPHAARVAPGPVARGGAGAAVPLRRVGRARPHLGRPRRGLPRGGGARGHALAAGGARDAGAGAGRGRAQAQAQGGQSEEEAKKVQAGRLRRRALRGACAQLPDNVTDY